MLTTAIGSSRAYKTMQNLKDRTRYHYRVLLCAPSKDHNSHQVQWYYQPYKIFELLGFKGHWESPAAGRFATLDEAKQYIADERFKDEQLSLMLSFKPYVVYEA